MGHEVSSAYYQALAWTLGLRSRDIAEIGGFTERYARDLLSGRVTKWPQDVRHALHQIDDDIDVIVDVLVDSARAGETTLFVFKKNRNLRKRIPEWPGRGKAEGGFNGPHYAAVIAAHDVLLSDGIETDVQFFEDLS